ncbi:hypothetical protein F2Q69_00018762 [Brassica cretica]|uniref:Uncharacterized protein n=1 Tax=Brassica cretica TaxID=69181 RepID=A0A8S9QGT4_BRACR|nr:hypothetical protein F2Q69_00018762 [Brassica cretica]
MKRKGLRCGEGASVWLFNSRRGRRRRGSFNVALPHLVVTSLHYVSARWVARRGSGRELEDRGGTTSWCGGGGASRLWSMDSEDEALWSSRLSYQPGTGKAEKERRQGRELRGTGEHGGGGLEK